MVTRHGKPIARVLPMRSKQPTAAISRLTVVELRGLLARRRRAGDETGEVRAVELHGLPFLVATLFQPERAALKGEAAPLVGTFVTACAAGGECQ